MTFESQTLLEPPALEPVSLDEAKHYLRVSDTQDDGLIAGLISTARQMAEQITRRAFVSQTWRYQREGLPSEPFLVLPKSPLRSVLSVGLRELSGTVSLIDESLYLGEGGSSLGRVILKSALSWPCSTDTTGLQVDYVAGYGAAAQNVPSPLRQGILAHVAFLYTHRGDVLGADGQLRVEAAAALPSQTMALYAPYRVLSARGGLA